MNTSIFENIFNCISEIDLVRKEDNSIFTYSYAKEGKYQNSDYHAFGELEFCKFFIDNAPESSGVYIIKDIENDIVYYIGECKNLKIRFNRGYGNIYHRNVFKGGRSTNCKVNNKILKTIRCDEGNECYRRLHLFFMETDHYKYIENKILSSICACKRPNFWNSKWPENASPCDVGHGCSS